MDIKAKITKVMDNGGKILAVADITFGGMFVVHGLRLIQTEDGRFVGMPANTWKDKDGKFHNTEIAHPVTSDGRIEIFEAVNTAYNQKIGQTQSVPQETDIPDEGLPWNQSI